MEFDSSNILRYCCFSLLLLLYIGAMIWVFRDAEWRGKNGCVVALLVTVVGWPLGLILWLVFRPSSSESPKW
jgi:hypothetical protein